MCRSACSLCLRSFGIWGVENRRLPQTEVCFGLGSHKGRARDGTIYHGGLLVDRIFEIRPDMPWFYFFVPVRIPQWIRVSKGPVTSSPQASIQERYSPAE